jgi:DNA (cytosine-5)-methyltransferase 1
MFAGGGGTSKGIEAAVGRVHVAINHDEKAIAIHRANHPNTYHFLTDVREVDPRKVLPKRRVGLLWLSPDCTHHSRAKGGKPVKRNRRALANVGIVWAKARRPRVIILENVEEFEDWGPLDKNGRPDKRKMGQSFRRYVAKLRRLGYQVEWRSLVAADYGAPTIRKRLFMIARCDGQPIVWPAPTHARADKAAAAGLPPWRAAYECIDWNIPTKSIFGRRKELAEATMRKIHAGLHRFAFGGSPFIVRVAHGGLGGSARSIKEPMATVTASRDHGALVTADLVQMGYGERKGQKPRVLNLRQPLGTVVAGGRKQALVEHFLVRFKNTSTGQSVKAPLGTITSKQSHGLAAAYLVGAGGPAYSGKPKDGRKPMNTLVTENHQALVLAHLATLRGTSKAGRDIREPMPSITAGGMHLAEVRAFLVKYHATGTPQSMTKPVSTLSTKARLGLVTVHGVDYMLFDIGFRMLVPMELLRAQFGKYAKGYILLGNQEEQIRMIGNSVPPEVAEALVRANYKANAFEPMEEAA